MKLNKKALATAIAASLALTACGGSGGSSNNEPTTPTTPTNSAPTAISLSASAVDENAVAAVVGTLSATDADSGDSHTFTTQDQNFTIDGTELRLADGVSFDYEAGTSVDVAVTVSDGTATFDQTLTIDINDILDVYAFTSKFDTEKSSVSYTGQIARHALIAELTAFISGLEDWLDANPAATKAEVLAELNKYYYVGEDLYPSDSSDDESARQEIYDSLAITFADAEQTMISDISGGYKNLLEKTAGNDSGGQDIDYTVATNFVGWGADADHTPESLVLYFFDMLADQAVAYNAGTEMDSVYVTNSGLDLKQLIQKHLLMAVPFSQSAGDYLGSDYDGKGLTTDNVDMAKGTADYSNLEHQFDEGFGYFGAPVNYLSYTDEELAKKGGRDEFQGKNDFDGNGTISLISEYAFGASVNAAKRDRGAEVATDMTSETMNAFLEGRKIINDNVGMALTDEQMAALEAQRDIAIMGWEKAIAATTVHYINDTITELNKVSTDEFSHTELAKVWSEMKAFGLGLQFSPFSPFHADGNEGKFAMVQTYFMDAPVFDEGAMADVADYIEGLEAARDIMQEVYGFDAENVTNW